jgi:hypothetical protein
MAELRQFACPIVRRGTGFHADQTRRQSLAERHHLTAAKWLPDDDLLGPINTVNLEHVLGETQTNVALHVIRLTTIILRHFDAGEQAPSTTPEAVILSIGRGHFSSVILFTPFRSRRARLHCVECRPAPAGERMTIPIQSGRMSSYRLYGAATPGPGHSAD